MKIFEAAELALKELNRTAKPEEVLEVIKKNNWYEFNTDSQISVLKLQIKRRTLNYSGENKSKNIYFYEENGKFGLVSEDQKRVDISERNYKRDFEKQLNQIAKKLNRSQLTLFIGAGVSTSARLPNWNTMLNELNNVVLRKLVDNKKDWELGKSNIDLKSKDMESLSFLFQKIRKGNSAITDANLFKLVLVDKMHEHMKEVLYKSNINYTSPTMKWLARLCLPKWKFKMNSVITFNFDNILEQHLDELGYNHSYQSIYKEDSDIDPNILTIYHVHGFIPQHSKIDKNGNLIVFTEADYHRVYTDIYNWSNIVQLHTLKEQTCLFIGLSMEDPNLRRLLDIASGKNKNKTHYVLMQRYDFEETEVEISEEKRFEILNKLEDEYVKSILGEDLDLLKERLKSNYPYQNISESLKNALLSDFHKSKEIEFNEKGIEIIWYEKHDDLPQILKTITDKAAAMK